MGRKDDNPLGVTSDDPVYSQKQADSTKSSEVQPKLPTINDAREHSSNSEAEGLKTTEDDPVYSQSTVKPASKANKGEDTTSQSATQRLRQLTSHIAPTLSESSELPTPSNTSRPRRQPPKSKRKPKDASADLPADYSDILTHLSTIHDISQAPSPDNRGYVRQKTSGKLHSRERIALLLDQDSFRELGSATGTATWLVDAQNPQREHIKTFTPSNNPQGFGRVTCPVTQQKRQVYLTADDFTIRSGHADGSNKDRTLYGEKLALKLKVPVVKLVDGSSGGGSVSTIKTQGYAYIPHVHVLGTVVQQLNAGIPNLGAVLGPAIGLGAARVVSTHFSVMAADIGSMFNAGPKVVEGATFEEGLSFAELGGPDVHCRNGTIDNLAKDEMACFQQIKTVLGFLPDCGNVQHPPVLPEDWSGDDVHRTDDGLRSIIPRRKARMYNPYTIVESVVDKKSWFEIGSLWGRTGITGLARLGGRPVAILSNNCEVNGGALDAQGSQKLMKMIKFADIFNLPIVQFVDVPGYAIGTVAERSATMKWGVELAKAYYTSTTPIFSVITRRCYGVAGGVMLDSRDPWMRIAWPSAQWGSLPLDGGIEVGHRHELKQAREAAEAKSPGSGNDAFKARYKELEDDYLRMMNPVRSANAFNVEEIVDPKDTRSICCRWTREMYGVVMQERLANRAAGRIHPVFS